MTPEQLLAKLTLAKQAVTTEPLAKAAQRAVEASSAQMARAGRPVVYRVSQTATEVVVTHPRSAAARAVLRRNLSRERATVTQDYLNQVQQGLR